MPEDRNLAAMRAYYERGEEETRLADRAAGLLEFERTKERVPQLLGIGRHLLATAQAEPDGARAGA